MNLELAEASTTLGVVEVIAGPSAAVATVETPLSTQSLSTEEIKSNPGGNFDISKVIQSLPGVSSSVGTISMASKCRSSITSPRREVPEARREY
jgi:hypothetical protein